MERLRTDYRARARSAGAAGGNPTGSYRTTEPVRVVEEILDWQPPPPQLVQQMRERMAELAELGIEAMDD